MGNRCADHVTPLYPQKLAVTSPTGGGHSVGIVRSRTKATEFSLVIYLDSETVILVFSVMWNSELVRTKLDLVTVTTTRWEKKHGMCVFQIQFCKQVLILLLVRGERESLVN